MGENELKKDCATLNLSTETYSLTTIYAAAYSFIDRAHILLDKDDTFIVRLYPKKLQDPEQLKKDFMSELINQGYYFAQFEKTKEITKLLVERAFFSTDNNLIKKAEEQEINDKIKEMGNAEFYEDD